MLRYNGPDCKRGWRGSSDALRLFFLCVFGFVCVFECVCVLWCVCVMVCVCLSVCVCLGVWVCVLEGWGCKCVSSKSEWSLYVLHFYSCVCFWKYVICIGGFSLSLLDTSFSPALFSAWHTFLKERGGGGMHANIPSNFYLFLQLSATMWMPFTRASKQEKKTGTTWSNVLDSNQRDPFS